MLTLKIRDSLKNNALNEILMIKDIIDFSPECIVDLGANIGYYSEVFLDNFPNAQVHAYEPHPDNLSLLTKIKNDRLKIYPYGISNRNFKAKIGMRDDGKDNNGTYGIYGKVNLTEVEFKDGNNETLLPDFAKIDVEGSELDILSCEKFLSNTKAILIELVYKDDFKHNDLIKKRLLDLNFKFSKQVDKNDQLWLRL